MSGESWQTNGDCRECRRKPYCKKMCGAKKRRRDRIQEQIVRQVFTETLAGADWLKERGAE